MSRPSVKNQLLEVSQDYLGPAAERFVDRQIATHLNKRPSSLTIRDLNKLIDWLKLSFALLTKDSRLVDEYVERLYLIANGQAKEALSEQWHQK